MPNRYGGRENLEAIEFLRQMNTLTHAEQPGSITIAEESTSFPSVSRPTYLGGLGFTYKWNMGWMNDMLEYVKKDPVYRRWDHTHLTFSLLYAFTENFILPFSHDEVVHGKGSMFGKIPGDDWQKAATLRALYGFMYAHPGKKLMFMGCEFGQRREWNYDQSLDWHLLDEPLHSGLRQFVTDLNRAYTTRAGAARGRFRSARVSVDRLQRQRKQRRLVNPPGTGSRGLRGRAPELHARAARRLPHRRPRGPAATSSCSTATPKSTAAATAATAASSFTEPIASHGHNAVAAPAHPSARFPPAEARGVRSFVSMARR